MLRSRGLADWISRRVDACPSNSGLMRLHSLASARSKDSQETSGYGVES